MFNNTARSPKICILVDKVGTSAFYSGTIFSGWEQEFIDGKLRRAGFLPHEVKYVSISSTNGFPSGDDFSRCLGVLNDLLPVVIVPMGEAALKFTTGKTSLWKWHLSPLDTLPTFNTRKAIPTYGPDAIRKQPELGLYLELALRRARAESSTCNFTRKPKRFMLNPRIDETFKVLNELSGASHLSIDIETGAGQINTVGFAWSESDAIAINVLPQNYGPDNYYKLWEAIRVLLEGPAKKIFQNAIYEIMYFSQYGVEVKNLWHDTMIAQKFLYPELDKGLANVGRLFTNEPYWKDAGRDTEGESEVRDWANIKDWPRHYKYNCDDTSGTFEAAFNQRKDLTTRGMERMFDEYIMQMFGPASEMCIRGLPVNHAVRAKLYKANEDEIARLTASLSTPINPNSSKQKLALFAGKGYKLPRKRNKDTGLLRDSADELSLKELRLKHPEDMDISSLLAIAKLQKANSSYLTSDITDSDYVRFMLCVHGTETGRWSCNGDHRYMGFNAQTIPSYAKKMIEWHPDMGRVFIQCDLKQAESRFVAYACADTNLISMLEDPTQDVHKHVAHQIIKTLGVDVSRVGPEEFKKKWRQLGKKSGHGANYAMQANTFIKSCLKEMDLVLTKKEAEGILEAYHTLFPGIRRGHRAIEQEIRTKRQLTNPLGRVRQFFGRMDDNTFREGYAYLPQSTVPDIINHLMLHLEKKRRSGELKFWFHLQCHDSLTLSAKLEDVAPIAATMTNIREWHPQIKLLAGNLWIPTEVETGANLGELSEYKPT